MTWNRRSTFRRKPNLELRHLDDLCREIVFHRDEFKCWDCGLEITDVRHRKDDNWPWYPHHHWSHVFGRGHVSMKWLPLNVSCSCLPCHRAWHDSNPTVSAARLAKFKSLHGERFANLEEISKHRGRGFFVMDDDEVVERVSQAELGERLAHAYNAIRKQTMGYAAMGTSGKSKDAVGAF